MNEGRYGWTVGQPRSISVQIPGQSSPFFFLSSKHFNETIDPIFNNSIIDHFNAQVDFPKLVKYIGSFRATIGKQEEDILLLEKAPGISLKKFRAENSKMTLEELSPHLERIGTVLGKFHAFDNAGWSHGDLTSNSDNVFYDKDTMILTLIDYGQLKRKLDLDKQVCKEAQHISRYIFRCFSSPGEQKIFFEHYLAELPGGIKEKTKTSIFIE